MIVNQDKSALEEHIPNQHASNFLILLKEADKHIWLGCSKHTKLLIMTRLLNLKSESYMPSYNV